MGTMWAEGRSFCVSSSFTLEILHKGSELDLEILPNLSVTSKFVFSFSFYPLQNKEDSNLNCRPWGFQKVYHPVKSPYPNPLHSPLREDL